MATNHSLAQPSDSFASPVLRLTAKQERTGGRVPNVSHVRREVMRAHLAVETANLVN